MASGKPIRIWLWSRTPPNQGATFEQINLSSYAYLLNLASQGSGMYITSYDYFLESYDQGLHYSGYTSYLASCEDELLVFHGKPFLSGDGGFTMHSGRG